jgi:hypothetical protein
MDPNSFVEFEIGANDVEGNKFVLEAFVTENGIEVVKIEELGFYRRYFKDLEIYPNPVDQVMNLSYSKLLAEEVYVEVVDLTGKVLFKQTLNRGYNQEYSFETSGLPDGFYILNFVDSSRADKVVTTMKVLVKHH